jgi:hypothetical protein
MLKKLILLAALAAAAPAAAEPMILLPSGHPVAEVKVDGQGPFRFIIDTAATSTTVLPALRAALPGGLKVAGTQSLSGAAGQTQIETVSLGTIDVGPRSFTGLTAFSLPPSPIDKLQVHGVLGSDILARYALEMDLGNGSWHLHDSAAVAGVDAMLTVPITLDEALTPRLSVRLDGVELPAVLDTGAQGTIINWAAAGLFGLTPGSKGLDKGAAVQGVSAHATASATRRFGKLEAGAARLAEPKIVIADLPIFQVLGIADGPAMILGIDAFASRRIVIDHPGLRLFVDSRASPAPSALGTAAAR